MPTPFVTVDEWIKGPTPPGSVIRFDTDEELQKLRDFLHANLGILPPRTSDERYSSEETCLDRAQRITQERGDNRGHPITNITRYAKILEGIFGIEVSLTQASLALLGIKIARESNNHSRDNVDDMAGYARVLEAVQKEEGTW